jgi:ubiquinol-cytochrome c reductase core subunit 2
MLAVQDEAVQAGANPATVALETAHRLAFRTGLGNGLFAPSHAPVNVHDIKQYADSVLVPGNVAFLSTGLEADALARLVGDKFEEASLGKNIAAPTSNATKYYGGETRVPGTGAPTAFIGFGHTGGASPALAALAAHLQPSPAVKWGTGLSPLSSNLPSNAAAHAMYLPYSDAGLFGFLVQGGTEGAVGDAAKAAVNVLKQAASGLEKDAGIRAVAQAKFAAASAIDSRNGYTAVLGPKVRKKTGIRLHECG